MTFLRDLHFQWQKFMEKDMKTTTRDQRPSLNQIQLNMSTAFGKMPYPDVVCPVTTTFGKSWQGEVPLTVKNLDFISRLNLLRWTFPAFAVPVLSPATLRSPTMACSSQMGSTCERKLHLTRGKALNSSHSGPWLPVHLPSRHFLLCPSYHAVSDALYQ